MGGFDACIVECQLSDAQFTFHSEIRVYDCSKARQHLMAPLLEHGRAVVHVSRQYTLHQTVSGGVRRCQTVALGGSLDGVARYDSNR